MTRKFLRSDLSDKEAEKLVLMIKNGTVRSGVLVMKSIASTMAYLKYNYAKYEWDLGKKKLVKLKPESNADSTHGQNI